MNLIPPKVIGTEAYLWVKGPSENIKGSCTQKASKHLKEGRTKETKDFMKVEYGSVHHNKYDGCCKK